MSHYLVSANLVSSGQLVTIPHETIVPEKTIFGHATMEPSVLAQILRTKVLQSFLQKHCYPADNVFPLGDLDKAKRAAFLRTEFLVKDLSYRLIEEYDQWLPVVDLLEQDLESSETIMLAKHEARCDRMVEALSVAMTYSMSSARIVLMQLVEAGPVFIGNILSKSGLHKLKSMGLAIDVVTKREYEGSMFGYWMATDLGGGIYQRLMKKMPESLSEEAKKSTE